MQRSCSFGRQLIEVGSGVQQHRQLLHVTVLHSHVRGRHTIFLTRQVWIGVRSQQQLQGISASKLCGDKDRCGAIAFRFVHLNSSLQKKFQRFNVVFHCSGIDWTGTIADAFILGLWKFGQKLGEIRDVTMQCRFVQRPRCKHPPHTAVHGGECITLAGRRLRPVLLRCTRNEVQNLPLVVFPGSLGPTDVHGHALHRHAQRKGAARGFIRHAFVYAFAAVHAQRGLGRDRSATVQRGILGQPTCNVVEVSFLLSCPNSADKVLQHTPNPIKGGDLGIQEGHRSFTPGTEDGLDEGRVAQLPRETAEVVLIVCEGANPVRRICQISLHCVEPEQGTGLWEGCAPPVAHKPSW
mmetsp:Transcript_3966/g.6542  ORF Transcript_3966/g.6542 Transcript_3966/m.6542 type:complete len:352 (+) Transcript_3966:303-1358(+)